MRQNIHESQCKKLLGMQCHKNLFDESKDEMLVSFESHQFGAFGFRSDKQTMLNIHQ